ncbi:P-loop NTPase fold protein [Pseudanabaena sp. ABRG5-3]|uniref:KAP family P-loop NTPase fold protein n=1 Tax=Pseudanabaena sp. ABRG5-3 TaxID=685565 RepID=UPI000DC735E1|nr:P-loop NTPase fold protein [Pseudanabaena sp. ABRG5-3]BBC26293.1 KAP P-loop domain protein [Pseudanabaena sp. ABRG5-3]
MQIRHTKLEIPQDDPFKNDALGRKDIEPPLTQFVSQATGSFVLALDASWGSGKTTFLEMWQVKLKQAGHICIHLNAWQNDFVPDPLIAIVGELKKAIEDYASQSGEASIIISEQMKKNRRIVDSLLKRLLPLGVKIATHGLIDIEPAIEKGFADAASSAAEDLIENYEKGKAEIKEFRKSLADLASQVASLNPSAKVVIIIDELDRCRPTYAIELLERVKHLFDASGVVFILGIDRSQLNHSIRSLYGSEFDATGYLRRFIDLDYRLPEPQVGNYCNYLFKSFGIEDLISKRKFSNSIQKDTEDLKVYLGGLMSASKMSLREQEQTVSRLRVILQTIPVNERIYPIMLSILVFLRECNSSLGIDVTGGEIDSDKVEKLISMICEMPNIKQVKESSENFDADEIEAHLLAVLDELNLNPDRLKDYKRLSGYNLPSLDDESMRTPEVRKARKIRTSVENLRNQGDHCTGFQITVDRLKLTNHFVLYDN